MKQGILTVLLIAFAPMWIAGAAEPSRTPFAIAEQRVAACIGRHEAEYHPPYPRTYNAIMDLCTNELNLYKQACVAIGHDPFKCGIDAVSFASSLLKQDPIDRQFSECLLRQARSSSPPDATVLLSLCRQERYVFELSCRQRKTARQCETDADNLAHSAMQLR